MSDFVFDNLALPSTKSDKTGIPGGQIASQWWAAADANYQRQIANDLRVAILKGQYHGFAPQSSTPATDPGAAHVFLNNSGQLVVAFPDGSTRIIVANHHQVVNVMDFGAKGDDSTDDYAAIAAATAAVVAQGGGVVYYPVPPVAYLVSRPIKTLSGGVMHIGESRTATKLHMPSNSGPVHFLSAALGNCPTATSLVTGSGAAFDVDAMRTADTYFHLDDAPGMSLDGRNRLCIEMVLKMSDISADRAVLGSHGQLFTDDAAHDALVIKTEATSGKPIFLLSTTGGNIQLFGTALSLNTNYFLAFDWDGSKMRIMAGPPGGTATMIGSASLSGTIVQKWFEHLTFGRTVSGYLAGGSWNSGGHKVDSVRISFATRYTDSSFTAPSSKLAWDGSTAMLLNGTNLENSMVPVQTGSSATTYLPLRGTNTPIVSNSGVLNMSLENGMHGIFAQKVVRTSVRDVTMTYSYNGLALVDNCYESEAANIDILTGSDSHTAAGWAVAVATASGVSNLHNVNLLGTGVGLVTQGVSVQVNGHNFINGNKWSALFLDRAASQSQIGCIGFNTSDENASSAKDGSVGIDSLKSCTFIASVIEQSGALSAASPLFTLSGNKGQPTFKGCIFTPNNISSQEIFHFFTAPSKKILVQDWETFGAFPNTLNWNDTIANVVRVERCGVAQWAPVQLIQDNGTHALEDHVDMVLFSTVGGTLILPEAALWPGRRVNVKLGFVASGDGSIDIQAFSGDSIEDPSSSATFGTDISLYPVGDGINSVTLLSYGGAWVLTSKG